MEDPGGITFRRPIEADYPAVMRVIDDWWGGRKMDVLLPRLWLQHFTGTSWLAETAERRARRTSSSASTQTGQPKTSPTAT